jgi:hypothetical protein
LSYSSKPQPEWCYVFPYYNDTDEANKLTRPRYLYGSQCREWWQTPGSALNNTNVDYVHEDWMFSQTPRARVVSWINWNDSSVGANVKEADWAWVELMPPQTKFGREP